MKPVRSARQGTESHSPERVRAILEERALALARVPAEADPDAAVVEVVVFTLAGQRHAIETEFVREIVRLRELTPLPGAPAYFAGALGLRGQILAVIDLRKFFGLPVHGPDELSSLLVLGGEQPEFGILAESVSEVVALRKDRLLEATGALGSLREHVRGVTADALVVFDGAALLRDPRLFIDQGEEATGPVAAGL